MGYPDAFWRMQQRRRFDAPKLAPHADAGLTDGLKLSDAVRTRPRRGAQVTRCSACAVRPFHADSVGDVFGDVARR